MTKETPGIIEALKKIRKQYGEAAVIQADDSPSNIEIIKTGCYAVDRLLGCGGLPRGRIIEIFGQESSGKSTFCLFLIAQTQKRGGRCVFVDAENAFDSDYATSIGVDVKKLLVSQPDTLEEGMDTIRAFAETNEIDLIVIDSVAALTPKSELEGDEMLKDTMAVQARLMSKALRILTGPIARSKTIVMFINQLRENVGVYYGKKETTPGGKALKFYASVRLSISRGEKIVDDKDRQIGNQMNITAVKNKVGFPWGKGSFYLYYGSGVDLVSDAFDAAVDAGIIDKSGNTYSYKNQKMGIGRDQSVDFLRTNQPIYEQLRTDLDSRLINTGGTDN